MKLKELVKILNKENVLLEVGFQTDIFSREQIIDEKYYDWEVVKIYTDINENDVIVQIRKEENLIVSPLSEVVKKRGYATLKELKDCVEWVNEKYKGDVDIKIHGVCGVAEEEPVEIIMFTQCGTIFIEPKKNIEKEALKMLKRVKENKDLVFEQNPLNEPITIKIKNKKKNN